MNFVIDASVVAKCLLPEADSAKARALLNEWTKARIGALAPDILPAEVASMVWKRAVRGLIPKGKAISLYEEFTRLRIPLMPIEDLVDPALKLALHYGLSVYDGLYVALAQSTGWTFITADAKLHGALVRGLSQVWLLRDWR